MICESEVTRGSEPHKTEQNRHTSHIKRIGRKINGGCFAAHSCRPHAGLWPIRTVHRLLGLPRNPVSDLLKGDRVG